MAMKLFVVIERDAKGIDAFHGAFWTKSKAKEYVAEIASDQSEYEVRKIEVDENAVIQNPIFTI